MAELCNLGRTERALSAIGGAGLILSGNRRSQPAVTLAGTALLLRGFAGWCPLRALSAKPRAKNASVDGTFSIRWKRGCTVNVEPQQAYAFLHDLHNLNRFCPQVGRIERSAEGGWAVFDSAGNFACEIEIINDEPAQRLAWRTLAGATVPHAGSVEFRPGPAGRGTEVLATVSYAPGLLGRVVSRVAPDTASLLLAEALRRFKQQVETGESPVGPPAAGHPAQPREASQK